jgi:pimeloyl-ACP methyl ester carboxylesterase
MSAFAIKQYDYDNIIIRLATALISSKDLLSSSEQVLQIFPIIREKNLVDGKGLAQTESQQCNHILKIIAAELQIVAPHFIPLAKKPRSLDTAISRICDLNLEEWKALAACSFAESYIKDLIEGLKFSHLEKFSVNFKVQEENLPEFEVFTKGKPAKEAVILIPPCALPARFFQPWLEAFGKHYYTLILENPFLFRNWKSLSEPSSDILFELNYIKAVLEREGISSAHIIGICGGAPIALAAAAHFSQTVASVIICHGDLNFGQKTPRTPFQDQFYALLSDSARSVVRAEEVYSLFLDPSLLFGIPDTMGPFILYPYADFRLFQRYAKLNSAIMAFDSTRVAEKLIQPLMIVTSPNDKMAHPGASYLLHEKVKRSTVWQHKINNHHDSLLGSSELFSAISKFIETENNSDHTLDERWQS